jgi:hypothetical protein
MQTIVPALSLTFLKMSFSTRPVSLYSSALLGWRLRAAYSTLRPPVMVSDTQIETDRTIRSYGKLNMYHGGVYCLDSRRYHYLRYSY